MGQHLTSATMRAVLHLLLWLWARVFKRIYCAVQGITGTEFLSFFTLNEPRIISPLGPET